MPQDPRHLAEILRGLLDHPDPPSYGSFDGGGGSERDRSAGLLFLGNPQDPCPRMLLLDPRLEPLDIVAWQVIRIHAQPGRAVAFPSYSELMRWIRASRATVARAVSLLRLTRWLLLVASPRDAAGRFGRNTYALVDEPLPIAEMLRLDGGYVAFVEQSCGHRSVHVRKIAADVRAETQGFARAPNASSLSPVTVGDHLEARFERIRELMYPRAVPGRRADTSMSDGVQNLNADASEAVSQVQDLNSAGVQDQNPIGSSSDIEAITTTTRSNSHTSGNESPSVEFPAELALTDSQRRVLVLRLASLPPATRQDVLDEAAGRIWTKRRTADPVRSEFDYVARLGALALAGEFTFTDAGTRMRQRRLERAAAERAVEHARVRSEARRLEEIRAHRSETKPGSPRRS